MADDGEGSGAARGAHRQDDPVNEDPENRGGTSFLSRLVGVFTGNETEEEEAVDCAIESKIAAVHIRRTDAEQLAKAKQN